MSESAYWAARLRKLVDGLADDEHQAEAEALAQVGSGTSRWEAGKAYGFSVARHAVLTVLEELLSERAREVGGPPPGHPRLW